MSDLKNFILDSGLLSRLSSTELETRISRILPAIGVFPRGRDELIIERDRFISEVVNLAHSEKIITSLSEEVGQPKENESEDEFVNRAKSTLANLLWREIR